MKKTIKTGIIGCGRISRFHAMPAAAMEGVKVVACCDLIKERAEDMAEICGAKKVYTNFEEMIKKEKLDVVHICLPHYLHSPVACKAMELGCHVLTEKPMAISFKQGQDMVKAAKKYKKHLGVIFQNRYNAGSKLVKQAIDRGMLGEISSAKCNVTWCRDKEYYTSSNWKGTWDKEGGGAIIDQAIHTIDLMCWFLGYDIKAIDCTLANRDHKGIIEVEDCAGGLITFKSGVKASFWCMNYLSFDDQVEITVAGSNGIAKIRGEEGSIELNDGRKFIAAPDPNESFDYGGGLSYWGNSHLKQISQFYDAIANDEDPEINGELILETAHKMIMGLYDSGRNNKIVKFK